MEGRVQREGRKPYITDDRTLNTDDHTEQKAHPHAALQCRPGPREARSAESRTPWAGPGTAAPALSAGTAGGGQRGRRVRAPDRLEQEGQTQTESGCQVSPSRPPRTFRPHRPWERPARTQAAAVGTRLRAGRSALGLRRERESESRAAGRGAAAASGLARLTHCGSPARLLSNDSARPHPQPASPAQIPARTPTRIPARIRLPAGGAPAPEPAGRPLPCAPVPGPSSAQPPPPPSKPRPRGTPPSLSQPCRRPRTEVGRSQGPSARTGGERTGGV